MTLDLTRPSRRRFLPPEAKDDLPEGVLDLTRPSRRRFLPPEAQDDLPGGVLDLTRPSRRRFLQTAGGLTALAAGLAPPIQSGSGCWTGLGSMVALRYWKCSPS